MHANGLGSGIHTYGPLSAKAFLYPNIISASEWANCVLLSTSQQDGTCSASLNIFSSLLRGKVRNGNSEFAL